MSLSIEILFTILQQVFNLLSFLFSSTHFFGFIDFFFFFILYYALNTFIVSFIPQCSATCGVGVQTRLVRCIVEDVNNDTCSEIDKPNAKQQCNMDLCKNEMLPTTKPPKSTNFSLSLSKFNSLSNFNNN